MSEDRRERNFVRILISTDNHLGFAERDPIRCDDSFAAFEEVLVTARKEQVDFVILAGDLFHENKPTRRTLYSTMNLLREYCLGSDPIYTEILNDQTKQLKSNSGRVNFEDPNLAISLPIFAIHGNHDDPSRDSGHSEALAALDLLAVNNFVNYFGKAEKVDDIEIVPILIKKNDTYIALYGLGAIRDERLNRMWNANKIKFIRPSLEQDQDKYYNIFVVHQNRDYGRGRKNCLHENMIPEWIDLVIWGNEHESIPSFQESMVGAFKIFQPGSSVSCSLHETESSAHPKHMGILEVHERKYRAKFLQYTQVRPFIYQELSLQDLPANKYRPNDPEIEEKLKNHLSEVVNKMIEEAAEFVPSVENGSEGLLHKVRSPELALLRLKVDPGTVLPTVNQQRFGSLFVQRVANPSDILIFSRRRQDTDSKTTAKGKIDIPCDLDEIPKIRIDELVTQALSNNKKQLSVLPEVDLTQALEDYVKRKHTNSFIDMVNETLDQARSELFKELLKRDAGTNASMSGLDTPNILDISKEVIVNATLKVKENLEEKSRKGDRSKKLESKVVYSDDEGNGEDANTSRGGRGGSGRGAATAGRGRGAGRGGRGASATAESSTSRGTKRPASRSTGSKKRAELEENEEEIENMYEDVDNEPKPPKRAGRAAAKKTYAESGSEVDVGDGDDGGDFDEFDNMDESEDEMEQVKKVNRSSKTVNASTGAKNSTTTKSSKTSKATVSQDNNFISCTPTPSATAPTGPSLSSTPLSIQTKKRVLPNSIISQPGSSKSKSNVGKDWG